MNLLNYGTPSHAIESNTLHNITRITAGTFTATKPMKLWNMLRVKATAEPDYVEHLLSEFKLHAKKQRLSPRYNELFSVLIANMAQSIKYKVPILLNRNKTTADRMLVQVADFFAFKGLIKLVIGKRNQYENNCSWFVPSDNFEIEAERLKNQYQAYERLNILATERQRKERTTITQ